MSYVLITGASSGIGLELSRLFAKDKHNIVLVARNKNKLEFLKKELEEQHSIKASLLIADLSKPDSAEQIKKSLDNKGIKISFLVNNAGFGDYGLFQNSDIYKTEQMINVNILALTKLTRLFLKDIVESKGGILNVASVAAFQPGPYMSVYYATKAYVLSFSEALAEELLGSEVKVSALCPGPTKTNFVETSNIKDPEFLGKNIPSAKAVAEYGYNAFLKGERVIVHGFRNKLLTKTVRFLPRKIVTKIVKKIMR